MGGTVQHDHGLPSGSLILITLIPRPFSLLEVVAENLEHLCCVGRKKIINCKLLSDELSWVVPGELRG